MPKTDTEQTTEVGEALASVARSMAVNEEMIGRLHAKSVTMTPEMIAAIRHHATAIAQYAEEMREP